MRFTARGITWSNVTCPGWGLPHPVPCLEGGGWCPHSPGQDGLLPQNGPGTSQHGVPPMKGPETNGSIMRWRWDTPARTCDQWKYYGDGDGYKPPPERTWDQSTWCTPQEGT